MSLSDLLQTAETGTPEFYKLNLPVAYVLEQNGIYLEQKGDKLGAPCFMHEDSDPSLDVWREESGDRWGCFPCGTGAGDVLDLVGRLYDAPRFAQQMDKAKEMYDSIPPGWVAPVQAARSSLWDPEVAAETVAASQIADSTPLWDFLSAKGLNLDPEGMRDEWKIGCRDGEIIIPFYNRAGELVAYKHRTAKTKAMSAPGSLLRDVLYGEWRDTDPTKPVILCEGESDTWIAAAALPQYAVLGLAAGAGGHARTAKSLAGRRVLLAFDGDDAGRKATLRWFDALDAEGCTVEFVPVPDGADLASVDDPGALVERTRSLKPAPESFREQGDIYVRPGKDTNTMLSNWRLEPTTELVDAEGGTAYEGVIHPGGKSVTITSYDLSSKSRIVAWCNRHGVSWLGVDRDAQQLLALLQHRGPFLPTGNLVSTAGLHGTAFVWPGGKAGSSNLVYAPPPFDVHLEQRLALDDGQFTAAQIPVLRSLHRQDVMDPILGWLAAAPMRSLLPSFPTLAITGSSGSGKTTLIDTVVSAFSGATINTNLTSTTKHALASFLACTNAFPVWFDEYRPGARKDTQMALEQLIRDAYTAQISAKGGLGEHWSEISAMSTHAPIIVSGEDTFTETSHTERMVNLPLPVDGKNPGVLGQVLGWGPTGLPRGYLDWCSRRLVAEDVYMVPSPCGPEGLPGRQRDNLGTVAWGWDLLTRFCAEAGVTLSKPDLSLVSGAGEEAATHNPIKDALLWVLDETEAYGFVRFDPEQDKVFLRVTNFVNYIDRSGGFQLPGKAAAVKRYLVDNYEGRDVIAPFGGRDVACMSIKRSLLD